MNRKNYLMNKDRLDLKLITKEKLLNKISALRTPFYRIFSFLA